MAKQLTRAKAREILHDGMVHGRPLTAKQRRFFGAMSNMADGGDFGQYIVPQDNTRTMVRHPIIGLPPRKEAGPSVADQMKQRIIDMYHAIVDDTTKMKSPKKVDTYRVFPNRARADGGTLGGGNPIGSRKQRRAAKRSMKAYMQKVTTAPTKQFGQPAAPRTVVDRYGNKVQIGYSTAAPTILPKYKPHIPSSVTKPDETMRSGGSIHINPANKGKFNALKKRTGKTTEQLTHSKNPLTRKRAIFAQNAAKWHHADGGQLASGGGMQTSPTGGYSPEMVDSSLYYQDFGTVPQQGGSPTLDIGQSGLGDNFGNVANILGIIGTGIGRFDAARSLPTKYITPQIRFNPLSYRSGLGSVRRANEAAISGVIPHLNPAAQVGVFGNTVRANNAYAAQDQQARNAFDVGQQQIGANIDAQNAQQQAYGQQYRNQLMTDKIQSTIGAGEATAAELANFQQNRRNEDMQRRSMLIQLLAAQDPAKIAEVFGGQDNLFNLVGLQGKKYRNLFNKITTP